MRIKFLTVTPPNTTEHDERHQETPAIEVHEDEAVKSIPSPELHGNEATPLVTISQEPDKTPETPPGVTLGTAEPVLTGGEGGTVVQDSRPSSPVQANLSIDIHGKIGGLLPSTEY